MKFFMIEWWDAEQKRYHQEYYTVFENASARYIMLRDDVPDSQPDISTCTMEDAE